jgi:hypothetical protein
MIKKATLIIIILFIVGISGCTTKTASNGTFGEKNISIDSILISNNTTSDHYEFNGTEYYYVKGYVINTNPYTAFNVKIIATAYDENNNIIAKNSSAYLESSTIPDNGFSFFYVGFSDPNKLITKYDVKVVDVKATM